MESGVTHSCSIFVFWKERCDGFYISLKLSLTCILNLRRFRFVYLLFTRKHVRLLFTRSTTERCFRLSHFGKLVWPSVIIFCNFCCSSSIIKMDPGNVPVSYGIVLVIKNFPQFANVKYLSHYPTFKTYHGRFICRFSIMSKWWKIKNKKQNRVQTNKKRIQINLK